MPSPLVACNVVILDVPPATMRVRVSRRRPDAVRVCFGWRVESIWILRGSHCIPSWEGEVMLAFVSVFRAACGGGEQGIRRTLVRRSCR
jgi:hypothetical protein